MKVFFRLLIVFGSIDLIVSFLEYVQLSQAPSKLLIGVISLGIGILGLLVLRYFKKDK